jgi:hypothetical protein
MSPRPSGIPVHAGVPGAGFRIFQPCAASCSQGGVLRVSWGYLEAVAGGAIPSDDDEGMRGLSQGGPGCNGV